MCVCCREAGNRTVPDFDLYKIQGFISRSIRPPALIFPAPTVLTAQNPALYHTEEESFSLLTSRAYTALRKFAEPEVVP
ncbi:MAG: hypothetical protein D3904_16270 [Candidatus Electrothrix sp. EH2]|nr:hypothetical protein [Candidatus Electrothrix sp. EH2]